MASLYAFSHRCELSFVSMRDSFLIFCDCLHDANGSEDHGAGSFVGGVRPFPWDVVDSECLSIISRNLGMFPLFHSA